MGKPIVEKFRIYANAFESAVQLEDTEEAASGWSDIIRKDTELLKMVLEMVKNRDNDRGKMLSVILLKHRKESVRFICEKIQKGEAFEVEDRSTISL